MQAHSSFMKSIFAAAAVACATLAGCGGGEDEATGVATPELRTHTVTPTSTASAKVGMRLPIDSYTETFGATIESVEWEVEPLRDAEGDLTIADPSCEKGEKSTRTVVGTELPVESLFCETSVMAEEGAKGDFEVTSRVTLGTGATKSASFTFTVASN